MAQCKKNRRHYFRSSTSNCYPCWHFCLAQIGKCQAVPVADTCCSQALLRPPIPGPPWHPPTEDWQAEGSGTWGSSRCTLACFVLPSLHGPDLLHTVPASCSAPLLKPRGQRWGEMKILWRHTPFLGIGRVTIRLKKLDRTMEKHSKHFLNYSICIVLLTWIFFATGDNPSWNRG